MTSALDTKAALEKAALQTKKPTPDKKSILDYLMTAKSMIEGIAAAGALVPSIMAAIDAVHKVL